jgi:hypothetical protein
MTERARAPAPEFATFWQGPLDALAWSCLASFAAAGASLRVYAYSGALDLPRGVEAADARAVCPDETLTGRYFVDGKPSLATFADLFRYRFIRQTGGCWVDADILCLRRPDFAADPIVFGRQADFDGPGLINNAVLKLPPDHPILADLLARAGAIVDSEQPWGAIGPFLLSALAAERGIDREARDFTQFYPIDPDEFWKPLLPERRDEVAAATAGATFLHLWGELFTRAGYDRNICPPAGSFLHEAFVRLGAVGRFARVYGADELRALVDEWQRRPPAPRRAAASG